MRDCRDWLVAVRVDWMGTYDVIHTDFGQARVEKMGRILGVALSSCDGWVVKLIQNAWTSAMVDTCIRDKEKCS